MFALTLACSGVFLFAVGDEYNEVAWRVSRSLKR
jgi:hypothetical protein